MVSCDFQQPRPPSGLCLKGRKRAAVRERERQCRAPRWQKHHGYNTDRHTLRGLARMLNSVDSALPPKSERPVSLRKPLRQLSLGQDLMPASPLISTRNLVPGLSDSVVKLDRLGKGECVIGAGWATAHGGPACFMPGGFWVLSGPLSAVVYVYDVDTFFGEIPIFSVQQQSRHTEMYHWKSSCARVLKRVLAFPNGLTLHCTYVPAPAIAEVGYLTPLALCTPTPRLNRRQLGQPFRTF